MKKPMAALSLSLLLAVSVSWSAQNPPPRAPAPNPSYQELLREIRELKENQAQMQKDLITIKDLLTVMRGQLAERGGPSAPGPTATASSPPTNFDISDDRARGNPNSRVVMVEFSDYQCPYCGLFDRNTMPLIDRDYLQTGKIKYVFHDLPLERLHVNAFRAAEASYCAEDQGKYWELHTRLFQNQTALDPGGLALQAQALGLDVTAFNQCLTGGTHTAEVRRNLNEANAAGIKTTPSFVIGLASGPGNKNIKVLQVVTGAQPFETFKAALDTALSAAS